jgi:F-type H+-transporting ATPase subunit b
MRPASQHIELGRARLQGLLKNARFVSGHRFSDAVTAPESAPSGAADRKYGCFQQLVRSCRRGPKDFRASAPEGKAAASRVFEQPKFLPLFAFAIFLLLTSFAQTGRAARRAEYFASVFYQQSGNSGKQPSLSQQLVKESREAAGEDDQSQFKHSASVRLVAKLTGLHLEHAYWVCVLLNFVVIAAAIFWLSKKNLPGMFRNRTASIQKAMEEARKASEDANRRLAEIEARLSKLDVEIGGMRAAAEKEAAAEEQSIKAAAAEDARKIVESAEQEIAAAAKSARRELTAYAADLAVALAKKQIHVDAATDQALLRNFAQQLSINGGETLKGGR